MTDAPFARLLLFATLVVAVALLWASRGAGPMVAVSLHTPQLSVSVTL